ncbi:T28K15.14 PROTEIN [Salix koriyanagi]|uniref:T28K15.14 PROTEIN n=1 Tax=Salix koriyanagi TaxID=2511006 RepID=A0A9Q0PX58_9ROSI|nr:T28K15.14 PROTEIN [Salix koriyanagi]
MDLFDPSKEILMQGDFDLNSVQLYTDSFKEVIKKTILKQEVIFRTQVHELHELYRTQKSQMKNLGCKGCGAYNSWDANVQSFLLPLTNPRRVEPLVKETGISSISKVNEASDYELALKSSEELKLSLTTGVDYRRTEGALRTCAAPETYSPGKHKSQVSVFSSSTLSTRAKKDPSVEIAENSSFQEHGECYLEHTSSNEGIMEFHDDILFNNLSTKTQQSTSHQKADLDLNKVYLDDSSCFSNDPPLAYPSPASSAGVSAVVIGSMQEETCPTTLREKQVNGYSNEISVIPHAAQVDLNSTN